MEKHRIPGIASVPPGTPTQTPDGKTFIGGKSKEFASKRTPPPPQEMQEEEKKDETPPDGEPCSACNTALKPDFIFCPFCGLELGRKQVLKALGIELTDDDISEYLFKGYLVKEVELAHGRKAMFKSLLPRESAAVEEEITNTFREKQATHTQYSNAYALYFLSYGWVKFNGTSLGETPAERKERIETTIGVHLLDIASTKWTLFNRAISGMLEDPDVIKN